MKKVIAVMLVFFAMSVKAQIRDVESAQMVLVGIKLKEKGFELDDIQKYKLSHQESGSYYYTLSSNVQYVFTATCDRDCGDIDLVLYDENGNMVSEDTKSDDIPVVTVTPKWTGQFRLKVKMHRCNRNPCYFYIGMFKKGQSGYSSSSSGSSSSRTSGHYESSSESGFYLFEGGILSRNQSSFKTFTAGFSYSDIPEKTDLNFVALGSMLYHRYQYVVLNQKIKENYIFLTAEPGLNFSLGKRNVWFVQGFYLPNVHFTWVDKGKGKFGWGYKGYHVRTGVNIGNQFFLLAGHKWMSMKKVTHRVLYVGTGLNLD